MSKLKFLCKGGPFDGAYIWLQTGTTGTLVFSLNGQRGFYERSGDITMRNVYWRDVPDDVREKEG